VQLVTSDNHKGLKAAFDRHFQGASWQSCQVRFVRDFVGMVGGGRRRELAEGLREIFVATTREQALTTAEAVAARWASAHPAVARLLAAIGGGHRGVPRLPRIPVSASAAHSHHERNGVAQRRGQATHTGGAYLPQR
jgi:hypothetical protein